MARFAIVESGIVVNFGNADAPLNANWIPAIKGISRGWGWDGTNFTDPAESLSPAEGKKLAKQRLKDYYSLRLNAGKIGGVELGELRDAIQDAANVIANTTETNFVALVDNDPVVLNAAKIGAAYQYLADCSDNVKTLNATLNGLTSNADLINFVKVTMKTGWPSPNVG